MIKAASCAAYPRVDAIQALKDFWASGEEESYPDSRRVLASDADLSNFEAARGVLLPDPCKAFYRRVNGMTHAEWERDDNHPLVKFFSLQQVFLVGTRDASSGQQGATRLFAVAAAGHFPPDYGEPLFALELSRDRTADNPVRMPWNGKWLTVAPSFLDFASMASSRTLEYFQTLDPDFARLRQEQEAIAAESYDAWRRRKRWWQFWKRTVARRNTPR